METIELKHLAPYLPYEIEMCRRIKRWHKTEIKEIDVTYGRGKIQSYIGSNTPYLRWAADEGSSETFIEDFTSVSDYFLILRPLSDLTKEIDVNGERFIPIIRMVAECHYWMDYYNKGLGKFGEDISSRNNNKIYNVGYDDMRIYWKVNLTYIQSIRLDYFQKLTEWHFDVFHLIPEGLAIDINTLEK